MPAQSERTLIAALLQRAIDPAMRARILQGLRSHAFTDADCHAIFRAILITPAASEDDARQALTEAITRFGFPDLALGPFFDGPPPALEEVAALLDELRSPG